MINNWNDAKAAWGKVRVRLASWWELRWVRLTALAAAVPLVLLFFATAYYYVSFARILDARLHGERATVFPQVFARPLELRRGQSLSEAQLVDRLNDLGYAQRTMFERLGEFVVGDGDVTIMPRGEEFKGRSVRVVFRRPPPPARKTSARRPAPAASRRSRPRPRARFASDGAVVARRAGAHVAHQRRT